MSNDNLVDDTNEDGATLKEWMRDVNRECVRMIGLSADDLPDYHYWDLWNDCVEPKEAAELAIENAMDDYGMGDLADLMGW